MWALLQKFIVETYKLFIDISPYLLLGFFFAGLLHTLLGEKYIRKHFARSGLWSTIKAAIFGVPLPVCSCGVIPLAESLRKDGASKSATMAFLVSTPSSGIDSILATYALMGPMLAVFRPIASFLSGILVGVITHLKGDEKNLPDPIIDDKNSRKANKSIKEVFQYGFKVIPSEISKWLLIGVVIGGAIAALVPADFGVKFLLGSTILNYVIILLISIPLYVCATGSIPIAAALITKGVLPGAALALLIAGPATNSVTISFVFKKMGKKVAFFYVISIVIVAVLSGLLFDAIAGSAASSSSYVPAGMGPHLPESFKIACGVIMSLILLNSKYDFTGKWFNRRGKMTENKNIHTITVPDMTCQHCKMKITQTLEKMPEVQLVSIDLDSKQVAFETAADKNSVVTEIKEAGYHPEG
jgi:uncharacterized membrane protein YraQ (UPF0718 family)/copper chaperone CopZ